MPKDMDVRARAVWRRVMREMGASDVISAADADILRCYCEAVARYEQAARAYALGQPLVRDRGHLAKSPLHQVVRDHADQVRLFVRELGLSPAARANLRITPGPDGAGLDAQLEPRARLRVLPDTR